METQEIDLVIEERNQLKGHLEKLVSNNINLEETIAVISQERDELKKHVFRLHKYEIGFPPGHFYSPIPSIDEVKKRENKIFNKTQLYGEGGVKLNVENQLQLIKEWKKFYDELPFTYEKTKELHYYYNNEFFNYPDSIALFCAIRYLNPSKIIEVGSGFSSAVTLDVNEKFYNNNIELTFIEPYPDRLNSLLKENDNVKVLEENLEDVALDEFRELRSGDILFIDSTHVAKCGSDVNYVFSSILPALQSGVWIHFHDIMYPFEYPKEWIYEGRAWNEAYILKAFLQYNESFRIKLWNSMLLQNHKELLEEAMPLYLKQGGAGSIWIEKS